MMHTWNLDAYFRRKWAPKERDRLGHQIAGEIPFPGDTQPRGHQPGQLRISPKARHSNRLYLPCAIRWLFVLHSLTYVCFDH